MTKWGEDNAAGIETMSGAMLDAWAKHFGAEPRQFVAEGDEHAINIRTGAPVVTDRVMRERLLTRIRPAAPVFDSLGVEHEERKP